MAKYMGATFTALMFLGSTAMCVWFAVNGHVGGALSMGVMAAICGWVVRTDVKKLFGV